MKTYEHYIADKYLMPCITKGAVMRKRHSRNTDIEVRAATSWGFISPPKKQSSGLVRHILRETLYCTLWLALFAVLFFALIIAPA